MTLHVWIYCDADGCDQRVEGTDVPEDWAVVVAPASFNLPGSLHFCPTHKDGPAHVEALRAVRGDDA